ncbi:MAG: hypothetical protein ABSA66_00120 [Roseiarcus sp.]|jgi:hypothetical protein
MDRTFDPGEAARFLQTLRVATQTALALDDLRRGRGRERSLSSFTALAAKGAGEWRFPAAGLLSADGLVLAHLLHEGEETKVLALQAQGVAGLTTYALRGARLRLGEALQVEGVFDRDGALHIVLDDAALSEADLSRLEIELLDLAP